MALVHYPHFVYRFYQSRIRRPLPVVPYGMRDERLLVVPSLVARMTVVTQLNPQIEVEVDGLGRGFAVLVETHSDDQLWTVVLNDSFAFVTVPQRKLRAVRSYTNDRGITDAQMNRMVLRKGRRNA